MILDQGPTPHYFQLKNLIKSNIISHELKGKERLPSEAELCTEYGVNRSAVRQALSELEREALIYRNRGRGTFITEGDELKRPELKGSIENLITAAKGTWIKVLSYKEIIPHPDIAKNLRLRKAESQSSQREASYL